MYSLDILWSTGKAMEGREQSYSPCPAVCGCKRGRGEDREVIFVEEDGLRTYVCVLLFWMWRSQVEKEICGLEWWWDKFECVCVYVRRDVSVFDGWDVLMWSLTTDIMVKQTIHQHILDQRIPPLPPVMCTAKNKMCALCRHNNNFNVHQKLLLFKCLEYI